MLLLYFSECFFLLDLILELFGNLLLDPELLISHTIWICLVGANPRKLLLLHQFVLFTDGLRDFGHFHLLEIVGLLVLFFLIGRL